MTAAPIERAGVLGDIHAEHERLGAALAFLRDAGVTTLFSVGDIVDGAGDLDRCCDMLMDHGVIAVRGNHDRWLLEDTMRGLPGAHRLADLAPASKAFLESLPPTRTMETTAGRLLLCHGLADNDMKKLTPDDEGYELQCNDELSALIARGDVSVVIGGHTHRRMVRRFGHLAVVNAGTIHRAYRPCVAIVDFSGREVLFHDIGDDLRVGEAERLDLGAGR
jgi:putative phosphoesterase